MTFTGICLDGPDAGKWLTSPGPVHRFAVYPEHDLFSWHDTEKLVEVAPIQVFEMIHHSMWFFGDTVGMWSNKDIVQAFQETKDEEGCGPFFAAAMEVVTCQA